MPSSLVDAGSILAVDVGSSTTRATLFDVVEGSYRFIAIGQSPSTTLAPFKSVAEGVLRAVENLQEVTGRSFLTAQKTVIVPSQDGVGVDSFVATISAGPAVKTVIVGLLNDFSLQSANRLARTTYARILDVIGVNDHREPEAQIDSLLKLEPELVLIAGGTDGGSTTSVQKVIDVIGLACSLLPTEKHPTIMFSGNQAISEKVRDSLEKLVPSFHVSPNIRPALDVEDLQPASRALADVFINIRKNQLGGVQDLSSMSADTVLPTAYAEGRLVRFMSRVYRSKKGILGVDIGASATTLAAGFNGELTLGVYPQFGLGEGVSGLLRHTSLEEIMQWIPLEIPVNTVRDYIQHKSLYPNSLPATLDDLAIEQALTRQALTQAAMAINKEIPASVRRSAPGLLPQFEPIIVSGSAIANAPTRGQGLMMVLDGIQSVGFTSIVVDHNQLLPAIGAAAGQNSMLPVQILESGAFQGVASVVAPVASARQGTPILRGRLVSRDGNETRFEINQGTLDLLPFPLEETGRLTLQPLQHADVGFGPGRSGEVQLNGTLLGLVIDARGRPLRLPSEDGRRRELLKKWIWTLGG